MDVLIKADNRAEVSFNGRYIATIDGAANHGQYVSCMAKFHNGLLTSGIISAAEKDALQSAAAQTTLGKKGK